MAENLPPVHPVTIRRFQSQKHSLEELYSQLAKQDRALALYLRRRAAELNPTDLKARETQARLALEIAALIKRDTTEEKALVELIERWRQLLSAPSVSEAA